MVLTTMLTSWGAVAANEGKPLVGPLKPIVPLARDFPNNSTLNKNLKPLVDVFSRLRNNRGMQLAHLAASESELSSTKAEGYGEGGTVSIACVGC